MCVAVPASVIEFHGNMAKVKMAGVQRQASLMMLPFASDRMRTLVPI